METVKLKLVIAFDGTHYEGWQTQKIGTGVQQVVETALAKLFPSKPILHSSSRTDAGVHALGMVAHLEVAQEELRMTPRKALLAINAWLPEDIRVLEAKRVPPKFHARFLAISKQYRYQVWNHAGMNPLVRQTAWHVPKALDLAVMREAARHFTGRHDFSSFTSNPGYLRESTVRKVTRCDIRKAGALLTFIIEGEGFLYKMCRGMVGTLVQAGLGRFRPEEIPALLSKRDRRVGGMTAPAQGLILWKVKYPKRGTRKSA